MSLGSFGSSDSVPHARRILSDVGERDEEEGLAAAAQAHEETAEEDEDDEHVQEVTLPSRDHFDSISSPSGRLSRDFGREEEEEGDRDQEFGDALRERLEIAEAERDSLAEDIDGWRARCKGLEEKLTEEKRIGGVERDLARERIRKRESTSPVLLSLDLR